MWMLASVYGVLGVCCTRCVLHSVNDVLRVNSWSWHEEIERDDITLFPAMIGELWKRKEDVGCRWEWYGRYERIWDVRGTTYLIGITWRGISDITLWVGACTCLIGAGKVFWHMKFSKVSVSHDYFPHICSFWSSTLPQPKSMELSHPSLSVHAMKSR